MARIVARFAGVPDMNIAYVGQGVRGIAAELVFVTWIVKWFGFPTVQKNLSMIACAATAGNELGDPLAIPVSADPAAAGDTIAFTHEIGVGVGPTK
jgi:TM2 domain-containing membrane protein YozV